MRVVPRDYRVAAPPRICSFILWPDEQLEGKGLGRIFRKCATFPESYDVAVEYLIIWKSLPNQILTGLPNKVGRSQIFFDELRSS